MTTENIAIFALTKGLFAGAIVSCVLALVFCFLGLSVDSKWLTMSYLLSGLGLVLALLAIVLTLYQAY